MAQRIDAVLFDMGGTLRGSVPNDPKIREECIHQIVHLASLPPADWDSQLRERDRTYFRWARQNVTELDEIRLWTEWMLPDMPARSIAPLAVQLNQLWRTAIGVRAVFPETKEVVLELFRRGYRLGLVSNTTSSIEIPALLRELELSGCFETVVLSTQAGLRKPDPRLLLEATTRMGVQPRHCVYVGDRLDRDLPAARGAGFARSVILTGGNMGKAPADAGEPDHLIRNLRELLDLFPPRSEPELPLYDASLSTMWAGSNFPSIGDFMQGAKRLGFDRVELNHQMNSSRLEGLDLESLPISSLHEPCPADISVEELKERDWLISSTDEKCRVRGVEAILRTMVMAARLQLPVVVVHSGIVSPDLTEEQKLRRLLEAGKVDSAEYHAIQEGMRRQRQELIGPRLDAVRRSLLELLQAAGNLGVKLGLENRYHFFDIPSPDEMESLLTLAGPDRLGFVYDVGHAQTLDRLGFYPHEEWLRRFADRMIETHLHDVIGVTDHLAPGTGDVDFDMLAPYLPDEAIRTLELHPTNTPEQIRAGLKFLAAHGCIREAEEAE